MVTCEPPVHGAITRRLSPCSFETSDQPQCAAWLRAIGYVDQPRHGSELARLQLDAAVCIVWPSGLVICLGGRP
jgi:hypothetical protein